MSENGSQGQGFDAAQRGQPSTSGVPAGQPLMPQAPQVWTPHPTAPLPDPSAYPPSKKGKKPAKARRAKKVKLSHQEKKTRKQRGKASVNQADRDSGELGGAESGHAPAVRKRRRLLPWAILIPVLLFLGSFGGGVVVGWQAKGHIDAHDQIANPDVIEVPALDTSIDSRVPDIRGLSLHDARQALADIAIDPTAIDTEEVEWAGEPGRVIAQDPVPGSLFSGQLKLSISQEARVPELEGMDKAEAIDTLRALGVEPTIQEEFSPEVKTGSVLTSQPASGEVLPSEVVLTTAQAGSSVLLSQIEQARDTGSSSMTSSSCSTNSVSMNGKKFDDALGCSSGYSDKDAVAAWVLGRNGSLFTATVGVADDEKTDSTVTVRVLADGQEVASGTANYGAPIDLSANVADALRLEIVISSSTSSKVYLGDALIRGTDDKIDALEKK